MTSIAADVLREARGAAGWSQRELAIHASVAQPAIARIESGAVIPKVDTLERLLKVCGRSLEVVAMPGRAVDRSVMRELLKLTPLQRLEMAVQEAANLRRLLDRRPR